MTSDRSVYVSGLNLHCRESGPVDGPAVIAVHGHPGTGHIWDDTADALGSWRRFAGSWVSWESQGGKR
jgi:hypothetical protein